MTAEDKMGRAFLIVLGGLVAVVVLVGWGILRLVGLV